MRFGGDDDEGLVGGYGATRRCSPTAVAVVEIPGCMSADEISDDVADEQPPGRTKRVVTCERLRAVVLGLADVIQLEQLFQYPAGGSGAPHWVAAAVVAVRAGVRWWLSSSPK
jgi:hypothetical protein